MILEVMLGHSEDLSIHIYLDFVLVMCLLIGGFLILRLLPVTFTIKFLIWKASSCISSCH